MEASALRQSFLHPDDEFTPIPFWFWNDDLTAEKLVAQIRDFADKGVMGFVIHPRIGIPETIPYLSDKYMDLVEAAVKEAASLGMQVILYDEAMYPSGSAQGRVVRDNPEYASRGLRMLEFDWSEAVRLSDVLRPGDVLVSAQAVPMGEERMPQTEEAALLAAEDGLIRYDAPADRQGAILLFVETYSGGTIRGIHFGEDDGEPNAPASADLMNPEATAKFIRITHDRYYERVGSYFGTTIRAMFTDEPDILGRRHAKGLRAWTNHFLDDFVRAGGRETELSLLWFDTPESFFVRRTYRRAVNERLSSSYYKPLSEWCEAHGIALTGHPAASDDIGLLEHFQIPGQDVVWRWVAPENGLALEGKHSTAAKCSSDAARHRARRRNLNEFLGVCSPGGGWALSGGDMKWYIDWLAVRGVNLLCPHAFYYSIDGPRRLFERPPDVGPNNIWWPHYRQFAQYMKRLSWLMTDSVNVTPIAVLCREDELPWRLTKPLYTAQREFNYLEERLLISDCLLEEGQIRIASQTYLVLLIEDETRLEPETRRAVGRFTAQGGLVICLDAATGPTGEEFKAADRIVDPEQIVSVLDRYVRRDIELQPAATDIRVSHVVKEGSHFILLVNEGEAAYEGEATVRVTGRAELWDAWEGTISPAQVALAEEGMKLPIRLERRQSLIVRIDPGEAPELRQEEPRRAAEPAAVIALTDGWRIGETGGEPLPGSLGSWTQLEGKEHYSGTFTYLQTIELTKEQLSRKAVLDLGDAFELAEVWVNGRAAGVRMWKPYTFDISSLLKEGDNELRIDVTNSLANRYDKVTLPSGLLGPVTVSLTP